MSNPFMKDSSEVTLLIPYTISEGEKRDACNQRACPVCGKRNVWRGSLLIHTDPRTGIADDRIIYANSSCREKGCQAEWKTVWYINDIENVKVPAGTNSIHYIAGDES